MVRLRLGRLCSCTSHTQQAGGRAGVRLTRSFYGQLKSQCCSNKRLGERPLFAQGRPNVLSGNVLFRALTDSLGKHGPNSGSQGYTGSWRPTCPHLLSPLAPQALQGSEESHQLGSPQLSGIWPCTPAALVLPFTDWANRSTETGSHSPQVTQPCCSTLNHAHNCSPSLPPEALLLFHENTEFLPQANKLQEWRPETHG